MQSNKILYKEGQLSFADKVFPEELRPGKTIKAYLTGGNQHSQSQNPEAIHITIKSYADEFTKNSVEQSATQSKSSVFFMIKPGFWNSPNFGKIFSVIQKQFQIFRFKIFLLQNQHTLQYIVNQKLQNQSNDQQQNQYLISGPCCGFQLKGDNLFKRLKALMGSENPIEAKKISPFCLRAKFGKNLIENCCYGSVSETGAKKQIDFVFDSKSIEWLPPTYSLNSTLCIIKPHIFSEKKLGLFFEALSQRHINISSLKILPPESLKVSKYLDMYKFLPQWQQNIEHFKTENAIAMEVSVDVTENSKDKQMSSVEQFKKICGPYDPVFAQKIQPSTLRSLFGKNRVQNAILCTELPEDAQIELKLMFSD